MNVGTYQVNDVADKLGIRVCMDVFQSVISGKYGDLLRPAGGRIIGSPTTYPQVTALMWNGLSSVSTALRWSARFQVVVGLRLGRRSVCSLPRSAPKPWMGGRVKDRRSRSRSDAGGVLDAGTQEWMIQRRGGECSVVGVLAVGGVGGGHDASGRSGSVRRLSDVRVSRSQVGDAQDGAPD